jgi:hypothetical protein
VCTCNQFSAAPSAAFSVAAPGCSSFQTDIAFATPIVNEFGRRLLVSSIAGPTTSFASTGGE